MNNILLEEEKLREACNYGDMELINSLISRGVNVNSQNSMNGWSSLHWACKRGHTEAVKFLLSQGADPNIRNFNNETPSQLVTKEDIHLLLENPPNFRFLPGDMSELSLDDSPDSSKFSPPPFPSLLDNQSLFENPQESPIRNGISFLSVSPPKSPPKESVSMQTSPQRFRKDAQTITDHVDKGIMDCKRKELTIKVRVAETNDPDFIEVDIPSTELSYSYLITCCSRELAINPQLIERVRKLPNTRLRNDRDVRRLSSFEELEFVVKGISTKPSTNAPSLQGNSKNNFKSISNFKNQTILY